MTTCDIWDYWVFGLLPFTGILRITMFQKLDLFLFSDEGVGDTSGLLQGGNLNHRAKVQVILADPVSEMLLFLEFQIKSKRAVVLIVIHLYWNPLEYNR
jgi:hypothetical protein